MRYAVAVLSVGLLAASAAAQQEAALRQTLLARVNDFHTAHQHIDQALFLKTVAPNLLYLGHTGRFTLEEMFGDVAGAPGPCLLGSFKVTEPELRTLSADAAVLTYRLHQQATCNDVAEPSDLTASDAFARIGGDWLIVVHTETPVR